MLGTRSHSAIPVIIPFFSKVGRVTVGGGGSPLCYPSSPLPLPSFFPLPSLPSARNLTNDAYPGFLLISIQAPGSGFQLCVDASLIGASSLSSIYAVLWERLDCDMLGECGKSAVVGGGEACEVLGWRWGWAWGGDVGLGWVLDGRRSLILASLLIAIII